jgi:hypothetical protein
MHNSTKLNDRLTGVTGINASDKKKTSKILSTFIQSDLKSTMEKNNEPIFEDR